MTYISRDLPDHVPLFKPIFLNREQRKIFEKEETPVLFRNSSEISIPKQPCPCSAKKNQE